MFKLFGFLTLFFVTNTFADTCEVELRTHQLKVCKNSDCEFQNLDTTAGIQQGNKNGVYYIKNRVQFTLIPEIFMDVSVTYVKDTNKNIIAVKMIRQRLFENKAVFEPFVWTCGKFKEYLP